MLGEGQGGLFKAPTKEERRLTGEKDKAKFLDLRFERGQVVGFGKGGGLCYSWTLSKLRY